MLSAKIRALPISSRISYIYLERCHIERDGHAVRASNKTHESYIPITHSICIMLGNGTTISHQAIALCSEEQVVILWVGDNMVRMYAAGYPLRSPDFLIKQVSLLNTSRLDIAKRIYDIMFSEDVKMPIKRSIKQMMGIEGNRMKRGYQDLSKEYNVVWNNRNYHRGDSPVFSGKDFINVAINISNHILYNVCEGVIVTLGLSPSIGYIHSGNKRSFVFDIADTIKMDLSIRESFKLISELNGNYSNLEKEMRLRMGNIIIKEKIPQKLTHIINNVLELW